jgi:hypothetical protein
MIMNTAIQAIVLQDLLMLCRALAFFSACPSTTRIFLYSNKLPELAVASIEQEHNCEKMTKFYMAFWKAVCFKISVKRKLATTQKSSIIVHDKTQCI